jgi:MFS transporter, YNFM family, putative membrane transport protein
VDAGPIKPGETAGPRTGAGLTLALLGLAGFAIGANIRITDPLLPTFALEFKTTVGVAALVAMVFALAHGALQIVYGPLGDRVGKLPIIAIAAIASAIISVATAFAGSLPGLAGLRLLSGLATAAIVPLTLAFIGDTTTYAQRHVALARFTGVVLLGLMCGQVLGGLIAEFWGWRAVFYFIGGVFAVAGIGLVLSPELRNRKSPAASAGANGYAELFRLFKRPTVRHVLAAVCAQGAISFTTAAFVGAHLHDRFGFSLGAIGGLLGLFAAGGLVYSFTAAQVISRLGETRRAYGRRPDVRREFSGNGRVALLAVVRAGAVHRRHRADDGAQHAASGCHANGSGSAWRCTVALRGHDFSGTNRGLRNPEPGL